MFLYYLSNAKRLYGSRTRDRAVLPAVESKDKLCNSEDEVQFVTRPTISDSYDNGDSKYNTDIEIDEPIDIYVCCGSPYVPINRNAGFVIVGGGGGRRRTLSFCLPHERELISMVTLCKKVKLLFKEYHHHPRSPSLISP